MSKENTATERLSITANVVLLGSYLFMGVCLLAGAILVLTQPLPFAENPMIMKVGMGWGDDSRVAVHHLLQHHQDRPPSQRHRHRRERHHRQHRLHGLRFHPLGADLPRCSCSA